MKRVITTGVSWSYYDDPKFDYIDGLYLPARGEGDTMASQIVTAVNKLIYKWYNDGDVFDTQYVMQGWANDLSSYANWLYKYVPISQRILNGIADCINDSDYEDLLKQLADNLLDAEDLEMYNRKPAIGSIYDCDGPFAFVWQEEDDDDDDEYGW